MIGSNHIHNTCSIISYPIHVDYTICCPIDREYMYYCVLVYLISPRMMTSKYADTAIREVPESVHTSTTLLYSTEVHALTIRNSEKYHKNVSQYLSCLVLYSRINDSAVKLSFSVLIYYTYCHDC
jgi:hypothetical protein